MYTESVESGVLFSVQPDKGVQAGVGGLLNVQRLVVLPKLMGYLGMSIFWRG